MLGMSLSQCGSDEAAVCARPKLAPNQPNGSSALASVMVAMDSQLEAMHNSAMTVPNYNWKGQRLLVHDLLGHVPTDGSMINAHYEANAPLYTKAIEQFNASPSADHFNAIVEVCSQCHQGTCLGHSNGSTSVGCETIEASVLPGSTSTTQSLHAVMQSRQMQAHRLQKWMDA